MNSVQKIDLTKQKVLILEDSVEMMGQIINFLMHAGWEETQILKALWVDEAITMVETNSSEIGLIVLDMMLPMSKADWEEAQRLWHLRTSAVSIEIPGGDLLDATPDQILKGAERVTEIDKALEKIVLSDGGIRFLNWVIRLLIPEKCHLVVFTARDTRSALFRNEVESSIKLCDGQKLSYIIRQKPVIPPRFIADLKKLADGTFTEDHF